MQWMLSLPFLTYDVLLKMKIIILLIPLAIMGCKKENLSTPISSQKIETIKSWIAKLDKEQKNELLEKYELYFNYAQKEKRNRKENKEYGDVSGWLTMKIAEISGKNGSITRGDLREVAIYVISHHLQHHEAYMHKIIKTMNLQNKTSGTD